MRRAFSHTTRGSCNSVQCWLSLPGVVGRRHRLNGSSHRGWSHSRCQLHTPRCHLYFWPTGYKSGGFHSVLRFENSLALTELRKALPVASLPRRIQVSPGQIKEMRWRRYGRGDASAPSQRLHCFPAWKLSDPQHPRIFMQVSLHRHD